MGELVRVAKLILGITLCLNAGSTFLFCLFSPLLQDKLGYSQLQVNLISLASEVGTHIPIPFLTPLSQYSAGYGGPAAVSVISSVSFLAGYLLAAYVFINRLHFTIMMLSFFLVGTGFVALQIAGLTTVVGSMMSVQKALGLVIFLFGMSPIWQVQVAARVFRREQDNQLTTVSLLFALGIFLCAISMLSGIGLLSLPEWSGTKSTEEQECLLGSEVADAVQESSYGMSNNDVRENESMTRTWINPSTRAFLNDRNAWLFALAMFLSTGPAQTFSNNLGTLLQTTYRTNLSTNSLNSAGQASVLHLSATITRLAAAYLNGHIAIPTPSREAILKRPPRYKVHSKIKVLVFCALLMAVGMGILASGFVQGNGRYFYLISVLFGSGYGAVLNIPPAITSTVWGSKSFDKNWSTLSLTMPLLGVGAYSIYMGHRYDIVSDTQEGHGTCNGVSCYDVTIIIMGISMLLAISLWLVIGRDWRTKGIEA